MALVTLTINGTPVEAEAGRRLVEVIKEQGVAITNLCYIDGLEPYAGCRTCLVDIEGGRPTSLQLSCTAQVTEGMVVTTDTPAVKTARQGVMSLIMANHPDRCLTCHRRVHCQPGEICLRDDVVTHRCLTCAKNYRCELQTSTEMIDMGEFEEPWVGETRSYYETPPPEPDRANPYLEFDPQMCIICTRCVRACADIRHTGAISLSGKGPTTMIAFGTGGAVHESDCDFCGACIDVCPTATLMEKPNKWIGLAETWTNSVCNGCATGCTISYGVSSGRPVIVRPDRLNPVSRDQICVRGRFGYDAVGERERLGRSLARRGANLLPVSFDEALSDAVTRLRSAREQHGAGSIALLGSPLVTNEEAFLLAELARVIGTPHLDSSFGPAHRAAADAFEAAFGVRQLPASLTQIEEATVIVAVAGDLEEAHPVVALRIKDAVIKRGAKLIVVSSRWGELVPFAEAWLQPEPGGEAAAVQAIAGALTGTAPAGAPGVAPAALDTAAAIVRNGAAGDGGFEVVCGPEVVDARAAGLQAAACANLAIAARGERAATSLHYLPAGANVHGLAAMGITPGEGGRDFPAIIEGMRDGSIRAVVLHADNPLLNAPGTAVAEALAAVESLIVIDAVRSTAADHAAVVLADIPFFAKDGTLTTADHRIVRQRPAADPRREARSGLAILAALGNALGGTFTDDPSAVAAAIARSVPGYVPLAQVRSGRTRTITGDPSPGARPQPVAAPAASDGAGLRLITGRSLYTSWEGASTRSPEADKLHREEAAWLNPRDAEALGARMGDTVVLSAHGTELRISARLDDGVAAGTVYVPQYYEAGAVLRLFPADGSVPLVRVNALQPA